MRILVLGGTGWLSGHVARVADGRGHDVTCLARGTSGAPPGRARLVRADRETPQAYRQVADASWDVVFDVSSQPGQVRRATEALGRRVGHYVYVSSCSVYAEHATPRADETAALLPALEGEVMQPETYGEAKVACEQSVRTAMGSDRSLLVRAGLIGGPGDRSGRTGYWPLRAAHPAVSDGRILVPRGDGLMTQVLDVRDLADWLVEAGVEGAAGTFNATGHAVPLTEHLRMAREVAGHDGPLVPMTDEWLDAHDVQPWMGPRSLPLWLPMPDYAGFADRDSTAAYAAGLTPRPLDRTLADTLAWEVGEGIERPRGAGLTREEEVDLLARTAS